MYSCVCGDQNEAHHRVEEEEEEEEEEKKRAARPCRLGSASSDWHPSRAAGGCVCGGVGGQGVGTAYAWGALPSRSAGRPAGVGIHVIGLGTENDTSWQSSESGEVSSVPEALAA